VRAVAASPNPMPLGGAPSPDAAPASASASASRSGETSIQNDCNNSLWRTQESEEEVERH